MFKIELENRDFRKSLYFYIVDAEKRKKKKKKKRAASGCWHYIKSRANIKWTLGKYGLRALASALIYITAIYLKTGVPENPLPDIYNFSNRVASFSSYIFH